MRGLAEHNQGYRAWGRCPLTQAQGASREFQLSSPPLTPEIPNVLGFPDSDPVPVSHREAHGSVGINRKDFVRGYGGGSSGSGSRVTSTGC